MHGFSPQQIQSLQNTYGVQLTQQHLAWIWQVANSTGALPSAAQFHAAVSQAQTAPAMPAAPGLGQLPGYGGAMSPAYGVPEQAAQAIPGNPGREAVLQMPRLNQLGGQDYPKWVRYPFFPTAPFQSTDPNVANQIIYYSGSLVNGTANSESTINVAFDLPVRIVAINGSAVTTDDSGLPVGRDPRDTFLFRMEYASGAVRLHVSARLGSTVVGTASRPGELGGAGVTVDSGGTVILAITPLMSNLRIEISLHCVMILGPRNFTAR